MKINSKIIVVSAFWLLVPQIIKAQGTTYVSSLGQSPTDSISVGSDSWLAVVFRTGANATGYQLNSVQLGLADASGNPSSLTVMVYAQSSFPNAIFPGSSLDTLSGSANPSTAGIYNYTPGSSLTLSPSTDYFIVVTAGTTIANGSYSWNVTSTFSPALSGGWHGDNLLAQSIDGLNWNYITGNYPLFSINATPVPEPSAWALILLGGGVLLYARTRKQHGA